MLRLLNERVAFANLGRVLFTFGLGALDIGRERA